MIAYVSCVLVVVKPDTMFKHIIKPHYSPVLSKPINKHTCEQNILLGSAPRDFFAFQVFRRGSGGLRGLKHPLPREIPKALQNRAKPNPILKTVKNC